MRGSSPSSAFLGGARCTSLGVAGSTPQEDGLNPLPFTQYHIGNNGYLFFCCAGVNPVVSEITMLNGCKALLRQTRRPYFMMTLDFVECEVLYGLIQPLNRCKEQGVPDDGVCF